MSEESPSQAGGENEYRALARPSERRGGSRMRARRWVIAYRYSDPAEYGIPELPEWHVARTDSNGLAVAADGESEPFITADHPVRVRR